MKKLFKFVMVGLIGLMVIGCGSNVRYDKKEITSIPSFAELVKDKESAEFLYKFIDILNSKEIEDLYKENYTLSQEVYNQSIEMFTLIAELQASNAQSKIKDPALLSEELIRINQEKESKLQLYKNANLSAFVEFTQLIGDCDSAPDIYKCAKDAVIAYQPIQLQQLKAAKLSLSASLKKLKEGK